jgi:hypothetical protein
MVLTRRQKQKERGRKTTIDRQRLSKPLNDVFLRLSGNYISSRSNMQNVGYQGIGKEGGNVQVLVKIQVYATVTEHEEVLHSRKVTGRQMQQIAKSGKTTHLGAFADARGGFFIVDTDSSEEIFDLISPMLDYCSVEIHPVIPVGKLEEFFERDGAAG